MSTEILNYTEPKIVTSNDLSKRSYVEFYFKNERVREYHGKNIAKRINPNRAKSYDERNQLLTKLHFELKKALETKSYPIEPGSVVTQSKSVNVPYKEMNERSAIAFYLRTYSYLYN
jgi:hypothetical protein